MMRHQKHPRGNQLIREYMLRDYREPKDFASFLYVSQVLQAEGIKVGAEALRRVAAAHDGLALLAAQRLLAGRLLVQHRLLRPLEGAAVLREAVLRRPSS